jgi:hypothetical protein
MVLPSDATANLSGNACGTKTVGMRSGRDRKPCGSWSSLTPAPAACQGKLGRARSEIRYLPSIAKDMNAAGFRQRSSITELAFHGIDTSRPQKAKSVTHVSGTKCHPCFRPLKIDCGLVRAAVFRFRRRDLVPRRARSRRHGFARQSQSFAPARHRPLIWLSSHLASISSRRTASHMELPRCPRRRHGGTGT